MYRRVPFGLTWLRITNLADSFVENYLVFSLISSRITNLKVTDDIHITTVKQCVKCKKSSVSNFLKFIF